MARRPAPKRPRPSAQPAPQGRRADLSGFDMRDGIGLEAGRMGRRLRGWIPTRVHVNTLVSQSGLTTLARARFLDRNNPYAVSARDCWSSMLVGSGIRLSWNSPLDDEESATEQKKDLQAKFERWARECDAEGIGDLYGLQTRLANELFVAGEVFVRKRPRLTSDGLSVPLQLQLLPSEMLPTFLTMPLENGNVIRQGIEFDKIGRRVAYHFWRVHPGDQTVIPKYGERVRITADQILHVFIAREAGQIRGLPVLTPSIVPLWMLDMYDDAEMDRKKTAALFSLFIHRPDPDGEFFDKETQKRLAAGVGESFVELQPGSAQVLLPGEEIQVASPADVGSSYDPFQYRNLTRICAGAGLPYAGVTFDLLKANYSNMRGALIEARRRAERLQANVLIHQACRPIVGWFMDAAHISGVLDFQDYAEDPAPWQDATFVPPRWMWIDPEKDMQGEILQINSGVKARSHTIEETGRNPIEVDERIAQDKARAERLGLQFTGTSSVRSEIGAPPETGDAAGADAQPAEGQPAPKNPADKTVPPNPAKPKPKPNGAARH